MTVTSSGQSGSLANGFTYVVTADGEQCQSEQRSTAGGTAVTITGTNFASGATVTFGSTAATNVVVVSSTTITATTPAGKCRSGDGDGDQSGGQSGSLANGFTYIGQPTVTSVCAEQRNNRGRDGGDDHGHELRSRERR